jgi:hypothetical protein
MKSFISPLPSCFRSWNLPCTTSRDIKWFNRASCSAEIVNSLSLTTTKDCPPHKRVTPYRTWSTDGTCYACMPPLHNYLWMNGHPPPPTPTPLELVSVSICVHQTRGSRWKGKLSFTVIITEWSVSLREGSSNVFRIQSDESVDKESAGLRVSGPNTTIYYDFQHNLSR